VRKLEEDPKETDSKSDESNEDKEPMSDGVLQCQAHEVSFFADPEIDLDSVVLRDISV
jgi:hypothetical protein